VNDEAQAVVVRRATYEDAASLALVGGATFLDAFAGLIDGRDIVEHCVRQHSAGVYESWLSSPDAALWLADARNGGAPVGYAVLDNPQLTIAEPGDLEVKRIYVLSRFHGTGVGSRLMTAALDEARRRGATRALLGVYSENRRALAFYAKYGFTRVGDRRFRVGVNTYFDHVLALPLR
jgi:ribosomal protein S18 acetylase RimI-like enzyme